MALSERLFARVYDRLNARMEDGFMGRRRAAMLAPLTGSVLELGGGTGANLPHYRDAERVVVTEPSGPMRAKLVAKSAVASVPVEILDAGAERLPVESASFDAVVATLVLCTVDDVAASLAEVRRVLKPGGRFLFVEHGGGRHDKVGKWQRRLDPIWTRLACGCHLTRDAAQNVRAAGFTLEACEEFTPPKAPPILTPFVQGVALP